MNLIFCCTVRAMHPESKYFSSYLCVSNIISVRDNLYFLICNYTILVNVEIVFFLFFHDKNFLLSIYIIISCFLCV